MPLVGIKIFMFVCLQSISDGNLRQINATWNT